MGSRNISLKNAFTPAVTPNFSSSEKSKGILDDFAVRKDVQTRSITFSKELKFYTDTHVLKLEIVHGSSIVYIRNLQDSISLYANDALLLGSNYQIQFNADALPYSDSNFDLGSATVRFAIIFADKFDSLQYSLVDNTNAEVFNLIWDSDDNVVLTFSGPMHISSVSQLTIFVDSIIVDSDILSNSIAAHDIGTSSFPFKDIYAEKFIGWGICPIGSVQAWLKSFTNTPALPDGWVECNGQALSDADSVYNGQTIPNLNGSSSTQRFLRGCTSSGTTGGSDACHTHSVSGCNAIVASGAGATVTCLTCTTSGGTAVIPSYYQVVWIMRVK